MEEGDEGAREAGGTTATAQRKGRRRVHCGARQDPGPRHPRQGWLSCGPGGQFSGATWGSGKGALTTSLLPSRLRGKRGTRTPEYLVLWLHRPNATGQPRVRRPQWVPDHGPLPQAFRVSHAHRAGRCRHPSMQSSPISWQPTKSNGPDV